MLDVQLQINTLPYDVTLCSMRSSKQMLDFYYVDWKH